MNNKNYKRIKIMSENHSMANRYSMNPTLLPKAVLDLAEDSDRLVIDPKYLFFRESKPTFSVPDLQPWDVFGSMQLSHHFNYLWQKDGSLAVYAYLYGGKLNSKASYGCLYLGSIGKKDWTFGGKNDSD